MRSDIFVVGLTGGIGTGKSTAGDFFKEMGCEVIDADKVSKKLMEKDTATYKKIVSEFGKEILCQDKSLDRKKLADKVFNDRDSLIILQSLLADSLEVELLKQFNSLPVEKAKPFVILEAPVLYEYGAEYMVDFVLLITADESLQIDRVVSRNNFSREDVKIRIKSQLSTEEKAKRADLIVDNSGTIDEFKIKLREAFEIISKISKKRTA